MRFPKVSPRASLPSGPHTQEMPGALNSQGSSTEESDRLEWTGMSHHQLILQP